MKTASTSNLHLAALQRRIKAVREKRFRVKALTGLFLSITVLLGGYLTGMSWRHLLFALERKY